MKRRGVRTVPTVGDDEPESGSVRIARRAAMLERDREMPLLEGAVEVPITPEDLWDRLADVARWPTWIDVLADAAMLEAAAPGAHLRLRFRAGFLRPVRARIVRWRPGEALVWDVSAPGLRWRHGWRVEAAGPGRARLATWDLASGPRLRLRRGAWLRRFEALRASTLAGARALAGGSLRA